MRTARLRYDREVCYYHLLNRVAGDAEYFPFGDVEKEQFIRLVSDVSRFYTIELLSVVAMSNHYHIVCAAPAELPSKSEVIEHWRAYYGVASDGAGKARDRTDGKVRAEPNWDDPAAVEALSRRMRDISQFIKDVQQRFTCWFNRTRPRRRRGTLWADRFKNVILEGETALWECLKYVEMNPVRARLCEDPGEYRFSTWGRLTGSGVHPFESNLVRHLRLYLGEVAESMTDGAVIAELRADMARVAATERGATSGEIFEAETAARQGDGFVLSVRRRVRYWSDGAVIGSKLFVRTIGAELFDSRRAARKRLAQARGEAGASGVFSYRRLDPAL